MRIRTAIAVAALLPASLAFAVQPADIELDDTCRTDETRTVAVENEDGTTTDVPVEYCESVAWAQCDNAVDNGATGKLILPLDGVELAQTPPPGSFTEGHGCGTVDEPVFGNTALGAGLYHYYLDGFLLDAGNVDTLTFEVHFLGPNVGYAGQAVDTNLRMTIDGVSLFGTEEGLNVQGEPFQAPKERTVTTTPILSSTGASSSLLVTVTGIADFMAENFASEPGGGSAFRMVQVGMNFPTISGAQCVETPTNGTDRCPAFGPSPMVMGADEIPTGVTLNTAGDLGTETPAGDVDEA